MKKLFAILLLVCMVLSLCACDTADKNNTEPQVTEPQATQPQATEPQATEPQATEPQETEPQGISYIIKVVDEGGNPVANAMVQLCSDTCVPKMTNADGEAVYANWEERSDFKASILSMPEGYEAATEQTDFYFGEGNYLVTITLKAVA